MSWRDDETAAQAAAALGEPDEAFHITPGRVVAAIVGGILLFLWGISGTLIWIFFVGLKGAAIKVYLLLVLLPGLGGLFMMYRFVKMRKLKVLVYPTGILVINQKEIWSFPWDEIEKVEMKMGKAPLLARSEDGTMSASILASNDAYYGGMNYLQLTSYDGRSGTIPVIVPGFTRLAERVQNETFRRLFPKAMERFDAGEVLVYGPIVLTRAGLESGKKELPWDDVNELKVNSKVVTISKKSGVFKTWFTGQLSAIPNAHVLVAMLEYAKKKPLPVNSESSSESVAE
jgi:hypothetical protein